jgi:wobble nucleotide-excising tRNase
MKKLSCLLVLAMMTSPAWADCTYPKAPSKFPNGKTATRDEMVAAQKVNKAYQAEVTSYLECIKAEHEASLAKEGANLTDKQKEQMTARYIKKNDDAVDRAQEVANRYNEQLAAFNAKNKK